MSYSGPCYWIVQLSAECDPATGWEHPEEMHKHCHGRYIAHNPPPSGVGRTYARCPCPCHRQEIWTMRDQKALEKKCETRSKKNRSK